MQRGRSIFMMSLKQFYHRGFVFKKQKQARANLCLSQIPSTPERPGAHSRPQGNSALDDRGRDLRRPFLGPFTEMVSVSWPNRLVSTSAHTLTSLPHFQFWWAQLPEGSRSKVSREFGWKDRTKSEPQDFLLLKLDHKSYHSNHF